MLSLARAVLATVYVPRCAACAAPSAAPLCPPCHATLDANQPACPRCAAPHAGPIDLTCRRCLTAPPPQVATIAPWRYGGELGRALRTTKLGRRPDLARALAPLIAPFLAALCAEARIDAIVPVPLHWRRFLVRGFNHAELFAAHAAPAGVPVVRALIRTRATPRQAGRGAPDRAANVRHAFRARPRLGGARVVLFDDIMTTGATLAAGAAALRAAGVAEVYGFAIARAE
jgi:ComF family protein